jgi:type I restriction enzyme S subunit
MYFDKFGAIAVPFPPISEQKAISYYLDTKTAQIDRKIDLLTQKATDTATSNNRSSTKP